MKLKAIKKHRLFNSVLGAALTVFCGLVLWKAPLGEAWVNASYDYLFRFDSRSVTNQVVLIRMDNEAYHHFGQERGQPWDRALHAQLLQRLAADGCALIVFDSYFRALRDPVKDEALAKAMQSAQRVVLMAEQADQEVQTSPAGPIVAGASPKPPAELFLNAAGTNNWGVAFLDPDLDSIVRRHWPDPTPGPYPSLAWTAARLAGAQLSEEPLKRWLRYYGPNGSWASLSYRFALDQPTNYFRDKIVFIGNKPKTTVPGDGEKDEFRTPYTPGTRESVGGVEIQIAEFLNLMNGDWLRRPVWWLEALGLLASGVLLGSTLCRFRRAKTVILAAAIGLAVALGAVSWSHFTNYWFPWLVIAGGQVPCALVWALATQKIRAPKTAVETLTTAEDMPDTPDYELLNPPFGQGAYGKVWLARNAIGQWQALKVVYLSNFDDEDPYEREFNGIKRYKPLSDKHPGLLRVDFVSQKKPAGYFFYVMELGDPLEVDWESKPSTYKPRDLVSERRKARGQKIPVRECVRIGIELADALDFLHRQGLTHRDIKPQNIIFVNGRPKLADMGLIAEIRPIGQKGTYVGTPGYMPPPPELPGTPQADIYALGMLLYVLSTGRNPTFFPELSTTLADSTSVADFFPLNTVILRACHSDCTQRYASAGEMHHALLEVQKGVARKSPAKVSSLAS